MKTVWITVVAAALAGCAQTPQKTAMGGMASLQETGSASSEDSSFARLACQSASVDMQLGKLADANTRNKDIRNFAHRLAEDQRRAEKKLNAVLERKRIVDGAELDPNLQLSLDRLAELKGGKFDEEFKAQVIAQHQAEIAAFEKQAADGSDRDLQVFAQAELPRLREQLEIAQGLPISGDKDGPPGDNFKSAEANPVVRGVAPGIGR
jgi:putative membrane protein